MARNDGNLADPNYGKMRIQWQAHKDAALYRCIARDRGYGDCEQSVIYEEKVLENAIRMLSRLDLPANVQQRIDELVHSLVLDENVYPFG